jgi:hypothetical protein
VTDKPPSPAERQATALEAQTNALQRLLAVAESAVAERFRINREIRDEEHRRAELGRGYVSEPKRLSFLTFAKVVPGLASVFSRKIPPEFWSLDGNAAVIACPCGEEPVAILGVATFCGGTDWIDEDRERDDERDGCGRAYLYDGQVVRVAFSPTHKPQTAAAS